MTNHNWSFTTGNFDALFDQITHFIAVFYFVRIISLFNKMDVYELRKFTYGFLNTSVLLSNEVVHVVNYQKE